MTPGGPDEFTVQVMLETADAVYELSGVYSLNGEVFGGYSVSAARGGALQDDILYDVFRAEDFPEDADLSGFSIAYSLRTGPGGEAIPVENEIGFAAAYGQAYVVWIVGDRTNGYRAVATPTLSPEE